MYVRIVALNLLNGSEGAIHAVSGILMWNSEFPKVHPVRELH